MKKRGTSRATKPFMPLHGKRTVPHMGPGGIMEVGAEAMIDDSRRAMADVRVDDGRFGAEEDRPDLARAFDADDGAGRRPTQPEEPAEPAEDIDALRAECDSYLELARRERADFDNYRKRMEREKAQIKRESLARFLKEFFTPLDDMDRVLRESEKNHSFESLVTGVRIMEENFWRVLAKVGVRKIDAMGKPFDPSVHEAMAMVPSADAPPNTVLEVYEAGYKIDDFILRPARVVVSRAPDEAH